jgi:phosphate-selective porin OprO/OprP
VRIRAALTIIALTASSLLLALATTASADDESLESLLIEKGFITEEELAEAREEAGETAPAEAPKTEEKPKADEGSRVKVSANHKGLAVETTDGAFKFAFGGRMQWDAGGFSGGSIPLGDGTELRRGRIKSYGTVYTDWDYKLEVNFDPNLEVSVTDAWIAFKGWDPFSITVGHQKVPFSQQSMTSSNWQVFQERALPDAFIDTQEDGRRRAGVVIGSYGDHWNLYGGVFGEGVSTAGAPGGVPVNEDWGTAGRLVVAPIAADRRLVAVGGSVYYRQFESMSALDIATRPEAHIADKKLLDTGMIMNADDSLMYNAEASLVWGPAHAQGEYFAESVRRVFASTLFFDGWYVQAGFFLTGESRNYDMKSGKYKGISPKRRIGAWEIAARFSTLDLQSNDVRGGIEKDVTAGLNWWVNRNIMLRFNYVRAWSDPVTFVITGPLVVSNTVNAYMARMQIVF